jgi:hypothetical protein
MMMSTNTPGNSLRKIPEAYIAPWMDMASRISIVKYLYTRLRQMGILSLHGVPGDYNLVALDYVEDVGLKWVGDANELNAGV